MIKFPYDRQIEEDSEDFKPLGPPIRKVPESSESKKVEISPGILRDLDTGKLETDIPLPSTKVQIQLLKEILQSNRYSILFLASKDQ